MRNFSVLLLSIITLSCNRNSGTTGPISNADIIINKSWKAYEYKANGTLDPSVVAQQPTFQFRNDGRMYFNQIGPTFRDTLQYSFLNETNIKLTKPWVSMTYFGNIRIDRLTENDFDFTVTDNNNSDVDNYKTTKQ